MIYYNQLITPTIIIHQHIKIKKCSNKNKKCNSKRKCKCQSNKINQSLAKHQKIMIPKLRMKLSFIISVHVENRNILQLIWRILGQVLDNNQLKSKTINSNYLEAVLLVKNNSIRRKT